MVAASLDPPVSGALKAATGQKALLALDLVNPEDSGRMTSKTEVMPDDGLSSGR